MSFAGIKWVLFYIAVSVSTAVLLRCQGSPINNPYFSDFTGDYRFTVNWEPSPFIVHDTFEILRPYRLHYTTSGTDSFALFKVSTQPVNVIDSLMAGYAGYNYDHAPTRTFDSTITILFTNSITGKLLIQGIRPNGKSVDTLVNATVINPYSIKGSTIVPIGSDTILSVTHIKNIGFSPLIDSVTWLLGGDSTIVRPAENPSIVVHGDQVGTKQIKALLTDSTHTALCTLVHDIAVTAPTPGVSFKQKKIEVPVGQVSNFTVSAIHSDTIVWSSKLFDTQKTVLNTISYTYANSGTDTITVRGINRYGVESLPDTLIVTAQRFNYGLKIITYPDTVIARRWSIWSVKTTKDGEIYSNGTIRYQWVTAPAKITDSLKLSSDSAQLQLLSLIHI